MRDWSPEPRRRSAAGRALRRARRAPTPPGPQRVVDRLARGRRRATCSSACRASTSTAGASPPQALAAGAWGVLVGARARRRAPAARRPACVLAADDPLPRCRRLATRLAARARRAGRRRSPARPARPRPRTSSPAMLAPAPPRRRDRAEPQHRDRAAADDPRRAGRAPRCSCSRWRCAAPGQIAELARDRRARRRRDRQRRAGPPRAARLDRGDRRRQGGADRGAARRAATAVVPADEPLLEPHLRATDVRDRRRSAPGGDVDDARGGRSSSPFTSAPHAPQRARRGGRRARRRRRAARAASTVRAVEPARPADRAPGRRRRRERLLQRQPDVDARRPRRPRRVRGRAPRRRARRHARARARRAVASTRRSARYAATRGRRPARHRRPAAPRTSATRSTASAQRHVDDAARGRGAACPSCSSPGDTVLVKGSRGVGLEAVAEALAEDGGLMGEVLIAGTASLLICIFLSPKFIEFLREREFGQHIREEGPEGHHAKAGHADDGRDHHLRRDLGPVPDPAATTTGGRSGCSAPRSRARCSASPTTTRRSSSAARSACGRARSSS